MKRRVFLLGGALAALAAIYWWPRRWRYIVVHHSGGDTGDMDLLERVHRARQPNDPIDIIPYHFVVGNGRGMEMGQVVPSDRWTRGLWGAHVRGAKRNVSGIGICLIGNFESGEVPEGQYRALIGLVRSLMAEQGIRASNVSLHGKTPGEQTLCPGRNFPAERFFQDIA